MGTEKKEDFTKLNMADIDRDFPDDFRVVVWQHRGARFFSGEDRVSILVPDCREGGIYELIDWVISESKKPGKSKYIAIWRTDVQTNTDQISKKLGNELHNGRAIVFVIDKRGRLLFDLENSAEQVGSMDVPPNGYNVEEYRYLRVKALLSQKVAAIYGIPTTDTVYRSEEDIPYLDETFFYGILELAPIRPK